jgi:hypothetical protein
MNKHKEICDGFRTNQTRLITSESPSPSPSAEIKPLHVVKLSTSSNLSPSNNRNIESNKQKMKNLLAEWICSNIRLMSIVEDLGFKRLIEEAVKIGECRISNCK